MSRGNIYSITFVMSLDGLNNEVEVYVCSNGLVRVTLAASILRKTSGLEIAGGDWGGGDDPLDLDIRCSLSAGDRERVEQEVGLMLKRMRLAPDTRSDAQGFEVS